jgi:hypothetical protein
VRWFLSQTIVPIFKKLRVLGWLRFRILRWAYKIFWANSPRNGEWDFVLGWLRPLREWQKPVYVADIGSTESLLIYELLHRGYTTFGLDQRPYQEKNPFTRIFDISKDFYTTVRFDYILAISTIEHIGLGAYGDRKDDKGDRHALENIWRMAKDDCYIIITVPNKHLGTESGRGYSYGEFCGLIKDLYKIVYFEERSNQICAVLVKFQ